MLSTTDVVCLWLQRPAYSYLSPNISTQQTLTSEALAAGQISVQWKPAWVNRNVLSLDDMKTDRETLMRTNVTVSSRQTVLKTAKHICWKGCPGWTSSAITSSLLIAKTMPATTTIEQKKYICQDVILHSGFEDQYMITTKSIPLLTPLRPLLPYGYSSSKASCVRPG